MEGNSEVARILHLASQPNNLSPSLKYLVTGSAHGPWALALSHPATREGHGAAVAVGTNPIGRPRLNRGLWEPNPPPPKTRQAGSPPTGGPAFPLGPQGQVDGKMEHEDGTQ